ncbi:Regulator of G-protein signaling 21 [Entomophthora muscae]|uniref:Regulator of G-protein signaling 21 n=1 Tax=Entomophthora muscae TaxID=34485 RepID=A0ACC2UCL6_9FUNG|nr:Regulator of G-protein signaling 21 [Entomophthora muscae]
MELVLILTVLAGWSLGVLASVVIFCRSRDALAIRTRGVSLTVVLALTQWCMVAWLLFRGVGGISSCLVDLWMAGLLFPLWASALLARFLRIMFLHRTNQYRLNTTKAPDLPKTEGVEIHQSLSNASRSYPRMDLWLHTHRGWFGSLGLTLCLLGFLFFNLVITLMLHIISAYGPECPDSWVRYPSLTITGTILLLEWPVFILLFLDLQETFGIRLEWVIHLFLAPCTLLIQTILTLTYEDNSVLYLALHIAAILLICIMHLLTVGFPLWWARHEFTLFGIKRLCQASETRRSFLIQGACSTLKDPTSLTLQEVLANPLLFMDFKLFSAHNFCVENVMFYERFKALGPWDPTTPSPAILRTSLCSSIDAKGSFSSGFTSTDYLQPQHIHDHTSSKQPRTSFALSTTSRPDAYAYLGQSPFPGPTLLQEEILAIYRDFIAHDSPFQINLSSTAKRTISDNIRQANLTPSIFTRAYNEVYFLLIQDVFPRYLRSIDPSMPEV